MAADIEAFYRVWLGRITLDQALAKGLVRLDGMLAVVHAFPHWFAWSPMAVAVRAASTSGARVGGASA